MRAALDYSFWAAVISETGMPAKPQQIYFPLYGDRAKFDSDTKKLKPLVSSEFWELVEEVQPFQADRPDREPLDCFRHSLSGR